MHRSTFVYYIPFVGHPVCSIRVTQAIGPISIPCRSGHV